MNVQLEQSVANVNFTPKYSMHVAIVLISNDTSTDRG